MLTTDNPAGRRFPFGGKHSFLQAARWPACVLLPVTIVVIGCASTPRYGGSPSDSASSFRQTGVASYYAHDFHGRTTANGERFNMHALTAAHKTLPFNTRVKVTNLSNGLSVVVRINDRGPYKKNRIIDLSLAAAKKIGLIGPGTADVRIEALNR